MVKPETAAITLDAEKTPIATVKFVWPASMLLLISCPVSVQNSSFTKLSALKPNFVDRTPISFDPWTISTPKSSFCRVVESPALQSTARLNLREKEKKKGKKDWVFDGVLKPALTRDIVRSIGERASIVPDLDGNLRFLQHELKRFVNGKVSNCSNTDSIWEIDKGSLLLNSRCILYKSAMEEVRIWGWPLQTAGLLTTGFSSRSFLILSGRVTEWSNGKVGFLARKANASWVQRKWGASVIQLDPNTWIIEYRQSSVLENPRLISATLELLKYRLTRMVRKVTEEFWLFSSFENQYSEFAGKEQFKIPT
ncbi:uncharacterized protein LOC111307051 [Durio zibethinus]|uniref:Uncharacterized protein LOC111307051 n=1 Tax=Durio zibethinus TaxID=66656 RepID=A0A6P6A7D8_DURZI|nr:uncharacterized protein LOC111307051 [Durio zibethinus]